MSKIIKIVLEEEKFNQILIELHSSYEQLLDCDEKEWADEVLKLEKYLRSLARKS